MTRIELFALLIYIVFLAFFPFSFVAFKKEKDVSGIENSTPSTEVVASTVTPRNEVFEILDDKYLVSALYYSDNFIEKIRESKTTLNFQSRIVLNLSSSVTDKLRDKYIDGLMSLFPKEKDVNKSNLVSPLDRYRVGKEETFHDDAIDLFTLEGHSVKSMSYGVVVLSERGWLPGKPDKTVSNNGGNQVIIFSPNKKSFYRYCHLGGVAVETGDIVEAGKIIGTVGHSGLIASQYGHGEHLHLEINQYKKNSVVYLSQKEILKLLRGIRKK